MAVEIKKISKDIKSLRKFVQFGTDFYKNNPYFVPPLRSDDVDTLNPQKNPAFDFCESEYFMAYKDGKAVGRIAAIINHQVNEKENKKVVRFGFVEFTDDYEVSHSLFDAVAEWGKSKGMNAILGPLGFTDMDHEGALIEGFDQLSTMATIYNYPYYQAHYEKYGMSGKADWVEFKMTVPESIPEKHLRISEIVKKKYGLKTVKYTSRKRLVEEVGHPFFALINEAYNDLFGYSPLSDRQIDHYIKIYLPMLRLDHLSIIKDSDDNLIGMGVASPSMSRALQKSHGRMLPFGWYHLLKAMYANKTDIVDLLLVAIKPEYQSKGVNALLFYDLVPVYQQMGFEYGESNPELELNKKVQAQWSAFESVQHKRRRAFKKVF